MRFSEEKEVYDNHDFEDFWDEICRTKNLKNKSNSSNLKAINIKVAGLGINNVFF